MQENDAHKERKEPMRLTLVAVFIRLSSGFLLLLIWI
jgi:hypothetical protein